MTGGESPWVDMAEKNGMRLAGTAMAGAVGAGRNAGGAAVWHARPTRVGLPIARRGLGAIVVRQQR